MILGLCLFVYFYEKSPKECLAVMSAPSVQGSPILGWAWAWAVSCCWVQISPLSLLVQVSQGSPLHRLQPHPVTQPQPRDHVAQPRPDERPALLG